MGASSRPSSAFRIIQWGCWYVWCWNLQIAQDEVLCGVCCHHSEFQRRRCYVCSVAWFKNGVCNHAFHFHCISRWLKTRQNILFSFRYLFSLLIQPWDFYRPNHL
ncbi:hypothetical protein J5N97_022575 [Dioscorea zingiberensis]|uniref:Uncharacterized protein n=1 Tax=Dioscorea zingiberensis TaxID=325984 RepID=A0A9D5CBH3_9LILI|nr:hypothetical protein J5N97_022575 [Dioscorea zingiberensis]